MFKFILVFCCFAVQAAPKPELLLAQLYHDAIAVEQYWISEKLDGVRAYWDGQQLITRGGHVIRAPAWFTAHFPANKLDGELWLGRNRFAETAGIVNKQVAIDSEWLSMRYHVFEFPDATGTFTDRLKALQHLAEQQRSQYLRVIPQFRLRNHAELQAKLLELEQQGAEGLMLHHQDALYTTGRSDALLKLKSYQDTEATVIGYRPGKGKYQGMVGALVVQTSDGKIFALGSGLTDALRQQPPAIGTTISYRYNGFTNHGIPRFARFLRVRPNIE